MVKDEFPYLFQVINNFFNVDIDWSRDEGVDEFQTSLEFGGYDLDGMRREIQAILSDKEFDWKQFSIETKLCYDRSQVTAEYAREFLKYCIWDVLYPENKLSQDMRRQLVTSIIEALSAIERRESWYSMNEVHDVVLKLPQFSGLEFHNIFHVLTDAPGQYQMKFVEIQGEVKLVLKAV